MKKTVNNPKNRATKKRTISLPGDISTLGDEMAEADRRNFSNYVASLIERDAKQPTPA